MVVGRCWSCKQINTYGIVPLVLKENQRFARERSDFGFNDERAFLNEIASNTKAKIVHLASFALLVLTVVGLAAHIICS